MRKSKLLWCMLQRPALIQIIGFEELSQRRLNLITTSKLVTGGQWQTLLADSELNLK